MTGVKLVNVGGGGVKCKEGTPTAKWGCDLGGVFVLENVGVVITDDRNEHLYPSLKYHKKYGFFHIPGYNANSPSLIFNETYHTVHKNQQLRFHYGEALYGKDGYISDNDGESCADIFAKLCDV